MTATLAQRQQALVRALVAGGPVPAGFDPAAVAAAGEVCRHKRDAHSAAVTRRRRWYRAWR
ncbi:MULTISPECIES: hypothetical protein [Mycolicibacterium]|jgi:hypothetical protein|uniref:SCO6045-like C-terminal domain-containing protein n=2 Tax=Mycolicibacterium TaxID=1866885 RepID=A0A378SYB9_9MYCO|nr:MULTISPECIES: hypothetical protein [Mycolicibacterium]MCV7334004.1 hypothetical protein [Mycolicibacterium senegalense]MCW1825019.1 hypothetical protein [Mycolicibacterium senegalense]MDR7292358.1 hypothetical protein [Mycolicibacterium senegalense]QZA23736.1 hypothetical protein K3U95_24210 [Mycolicibacterium senegalense]QZH67312.1 hypothetical protein K6L26_06575 [Mycolicibacterium farcinogenes]